MTTIAESFSLCSRLSGQLSRRQAELRAQLQAANVTAAACSMDTAEVIDFKDLAAEDTRVAVDEVALSHAGEELKQITAALRRLEDGSYGFCLDCGEPIADRRLLTLPAAAFCIDCQAVHERLAARR